MTLFTSLHNAVRGDWSWSDGRPWQHTDATNMILPTGYEGEIPDGVNVEYHDNPRLAAAYKSIEINGYPTEPHITIARTAKVHETAVIGSDGFGGEMVNGMWMEFPHFGGVHIYPGVIVGANAVVCRGIFHDTYLLTGCYVGPGCHVGHGCQIEKHSVVSAGVVLGGSVIVGAFSWIGIGATVKEGVRIGRAATVGAGAVVTRDVDDFDTVVGVPARSVDGPSGSDSTKRSERVRAYRASGAVPLGRDFGEYSDR